MNPGSKRVDAWYAALPDLEMWAAYDACKRMRPWQRAAAWLKEKHALTVRKTAYYNWIEWCRDNELFHTLHNARRFGDETKRIVAEFGNLDDTLLQGVTALAVDAASSKDFDSLKMLVRGLSQLRKQELDAITADRDRLKARVAQLEADAAKISEKKPAGLTPEGRRSVEKAMGVL